MKKNKPAEEQKCESTKAEVLKDEELEAVSGGYFAENDLKYPVGTKIVFMYNEQGRKRYSTDRGTIQSLIRIKDTTFRYLVEGETLGLTMVEEKDITKAYIRTTPYVPF